MRRFFVVLFTVRSSMLQPLEAKVSVVYKGIYISTRICKETM